EVPSLSIARFGGEASFHGHTKNDRLEFVTQRGLEITQKITIMILDKLLNAKIFPLKREIGTTLKKDILKYMWNLNMEESKLEWEKEYRK
ncbi:MAG: hypothetical protein U9N34_10920, partial [Candidatus Cloacimonadota bacterium]|nr:hypothetical protein [Candidatus Cloacimonadota bacterium]